MTPKMATPEFRAICQDLLNDSIAISNVQWIAKGLEHPPFLYAMLKLDTVAGMQLPDFATAPEFRQTLYLLHREAAKKDDTILSCLVAESWTLLQPSAEDMKLYSERKLNIAKHPRAAEALMFNFLNRHGEQLISSCPINRVTKEAVVGELRDPMDANTVSIGPGVLPHTKH